MNISKVIQALNELAPESYAEPFDNVGLLVGRQSDTVSKIMIALDATEAVIDQAIEKKCDLIVTFHPIVFKGIKKFNGSTYVERIVIKAIRHRIGIYAIHTNLDNARCGVNYKICQKIGLNNTEILLPKKESLRQLTTYVPISKGESIRKALFKSGAGNIGNYDNCSFNTSGLATFRGNSMSNPFVGKQGVLYQEKEDCIKVIFESHLEPQIIAELKASHPYEEVAYEIIRLENKNQTIGMGRIGVLPNEMTEVEFLEHLKKSMRTQVIRHSPFLGKKINKVAVVGGSGSFALAEAKRKKADAFVSADFKYHQFFEAESQILIADIGHYESEQFTIELLGEFLRKKFTNFAIALTQVNTNPINYF